MSKVAIKVLLWSRYTEDGVSGISTSISQGKTSIVQLLWPRGHLRPKFNFFLEIFFHTRCMYASYSSIQNLKSIIVFPKKERSVLLFSHWLVPLRKAAETRCTNLSHLVLVYLLYTNWHQSSSQVVKGTVNKVVVPLTLYPPVLPLNSCALTQSHTFPAKKNVCSLAILWSEWSKLSAVPVRSVW